MATAAERKKALDALNQAVSGTNSSPLLSSVAVQLGGDEHPYGFSRKDNEFILFAASSAAAIASDAAKFGIRCWDDNGRQIVKDELAARVYAVHKGTHRDPKWFEPTVWGKNASEYWKPKIFGMFKGMLIILTMIGANFARAYYARLWNCNWPTLTNVGGIFPTPLCSGLLWLDAAWDGMQQSFVYGGAAAVAYAIPSMLGWRNYQPQMNYN